MFLHGCEEQLKTHTYNYAGYTQVGTSFILGWRHHSYLLIEHCTISGQWLIQSKNCHGVETTCMGMTGLDDFGNVLCIQFARVFGS